MHQVSAQRPCLACKKVQSHKPYQCPALIDLGLTTVAGQKEFFVARAKEERAKYKATQATHSPKKMHQLTLESQTSDSTLDTIVNHGLDFPKGGRK